MHYWSQSTKNVVVPVPVKSLQLAPKGTFIPKAYIWADIANTGFVCIGPATLTCQIASKPNSAEAQLHPGCGMCIYVDDPLTETFDLGDYWCAADMAAVSQFLYVTSFAFVSKP